MTQTETTAFNVVFEGHYVDGRDPIVAQTEFAKRYGDAVAGQVFSKERAVLKRNLRQDDALQMQGVLAEVGVRVALKPAVEAARAPERKAKSAVSLVERAARRSQARKQSPSTDEGTTQDTPDPVEPALVSDATSHANGDVSPVASDVANAGPKSRVLLWILVACVVLVPLFFVAINNASFR